MKVIYRLFILSILLCPIFFTACVSKEYAVTETYQETLYKTELVTETYTENQTSIQTDSGEYSLSSYFNWSSSSLSFSQMPRIHYYGYEISDAASYDNIRLRVSVWQQIQPEPAKISIFDMSRTGQIPSPEPRAEDITPEQMPEGTLIIGEASTTWLKSANSMINQAKFLGGTGFRWSKNTDPEVFFLDAGKASSIAVIISGLENTWNGRVNLDAIWSLSNTGYQTVTKQKQVSKQVPFQVERQRIVNKIKYVPFWEVLFP